MALHHHHGQHCHHSHGRSNPTYRNLIFAILLTFSFAGIEVLGGWWSNSLALLSDAGHMISDGFTLIIAAFAAWIALKPPSKQHSYGFGRAEIIAASFSSLLLLAIAASIIIEAIGRIHGVSKPIKGLTVIWVSAIGILVNLLVAWVLSRSEKNLNTQAALLHVLSDLLASFAALISGAVIYSTKWLLIDPILSIVIGGIIIISSIRLLRETMLILMEGVPTHIHLNEVEKQMLDVKGVSEIHDLHIWTLSSGKVALSAHVHIHDLGEWKTALANLKKNLHTQFNIRHVTLQPEPEVIECQPCDHRRDQNV